MNLRKTIAGAAITLGGTAAVLGLSGVAHAAPDAPQVRPVGVGPFASIDPTDPDGTIQVFNKPDSLQTLTNALTTGNVPGLLNAAAQGNPVLDGLASAHPLFGG
ncbi:hypothetical protein [Saccharothrix obliqua]|uniref:hypothetical protein n=1 Tax=Saccharothrix obliqua TaxID=2861747 RepID=UPI001C5F1D67|nr:hypothetical protein [Saccharothrix obliqua]MBW4719528.1 hypothetical protein [Saccharothrix obliqua]